jgi:hypothetical protein
MSKKLSKEVIRTRLLEDGRGITMIGEYVSSHSRTQFCCVNEHIWSARPGSIFSDGNGCPFCDGLSKEVIRTRLLEDGRGITMIGEYINTRIKAEFQCLNLHRWFSTPNHVLMGNGCPACAKYGFNPNKIGFTYILKFDSFIKYGITNNIKRRLHEHKKNVGDYEVIMITEHKNGQNALIWENEIKQKYGGKYVTKEIMSNGYTETLSVDKMTMLMSDFIKLKKR